MFRPFVIVVADDREFRNSCRDALAAAGHRVATPSTIDAAEYFLASVYPPHVVVFAARERWQDVLRDAIRRTARPVATVVVDRCAGESPGTASLQESVRAALEQLVSEPLGWRDELTLGVEILDAPHRQQVALLAELEDAVRVGRRLEAVDRLQKLRTHAETHFSGEESLLRLQGCHDLEQHSGEHARVLDGIAELEARWAGDDPPAFAPSILSLRDSLEGHIRTLDRALAHHLSLAHHLARDAASRDDR